MIILSTLTPISSGLFSSLGMIFESLVWFGPLWDTSKIGPLISTVVMATVSEESWLILSSGLSSSLGVILNSLVWVRPLWDTSKIEPLISTVVIVVMSEESQSILPLGMSSSLGVIFNPLVWVRLNKIGLLVPSGLKTTLTKSVLLNVGRGEGLASFGNLTLAWNWTLFFGLALPTFMCVLGGRGSGEVSLVILSSVECSANSTFMCVGMGGKELCLALLPSVGSENSTFMCVLGGMGGGEISLALLPLVECM